MTREELIRSLDRAWLALNYSMDKRQELIRLLADALLAAVPSKPVVSTKSVLSEIPSVDEINAALPARWQIQHDAYDAIRALVISRIQAALASKCIFDGTTGKLIKNSFGHGHPKGDIDEFVQYRA